MQKTLILVVVILTQGCTSRLYLSKDTSNSIPNTPEKIVSDVYLNNLSQSNFFIEKGDLSLKRDNSTSRFIFTLKYEKPDKFLVSIRSITGFEGARIYLTNDTILVNDRINKKILYGKPANFESISGLPYYCIFLIFGDIITGKSKGDINKTENGELVLLQSFTTHTVKSIVERKVYKIKSVVMLNQSGKEELSIKYSKFSNTMSHFPEIIEMREDNRNITARIKIRKLQKPWNGTIEFMPGRDYKKEEIR